MPMPARKMGVNPIFGLILVPVNGAIGVCYSEYRCIRNAKSWYRVARTTWRTHPLERLFLEIAARLDTQHQTNVMNALHAILISSTSCRDPQLHNGRGATHTPPETPFHSCSSGAAWTDAHSPLGGRGRGPSHLQTSSAWACVSVSMWALRRERGWTRLRWMVVVYGRDGSETRLRCCSSAWPRLELLGW